MIFTQLPYKQQFKVVNFFINIFISFNTVFDQYYFLYLVFFKHLYKNKMFITAIMMFFVYFLGAIDKFNEYSLGK